MRRTALVPLLLAIGACGRAPESTPRVVGAPDAPARIETPPTPPSEDEVGLDDNIQEAERDLDFIPLQGEWVGMPPEVKEGGHITVSIRMDRLSWVETRTPGPGRSLTEEYTVRLVSKASPRSMILHRGSGNDRARVVALYELTGDTLRLCIGARGNAPAGFDDKTARLVVLSRPKSRLHEARAVLEKAAELDLLSLDPHDEKRGRKDGFHDWKILGRLAVKDAGTRDRLLVALNKGVAEAEAKKREESARGLLTEHGCFQPRHGIRATHDGKTVELLICFECSPVYVLIGGEREVHFTTDSPQDTFDSVLKDAKVPLGPRLFKKQEK